MLQFKKKHEKVQNKDPSAKPAYVSLTEWSFVYAINNDISP